MRTKFEVWWPGKLSLREKSPSIYSLFGWFSSSNFLDVVVASMRTEASLSILESGLQ
ncbi:hypothetical protein PanWU01x14_130200, partial [Parasponia andersonii]